MSVIGELVGVKEFANARPLVNESFLLLATLDRAVLDYHGNEAERLSEASDWLFGESDPSMAFSFEWICDYLEVEPTALRERIKQLSIPRDVSQAHRWLRSKVRSENKLVAVGSEGYMSSTGVERITQLAKSG